MGKALHMDNTKERILRTALRLFAANGYEAVSVSDIAGELGVTKGALYRHFKNKHDILDSIVRRMEQQDAEKSNDHDLPEAALTEDAPPDTPEAYRTASPGDIIAFSKEMFRYWTEDEFAAQFRKMLTLEQFRSREMGTLYQQYLASGPVGYVTDLFTSLGIPDPGKKAVAYYAPMFLLYSMYDGAEDKAAITAMADKLLDDIPENGSCQRSDSGRRHRKKKEQNMVKNGIIIRNETKSDHQAVEELVRESFWNVYRPGCYEHFVLHRLRDDPAFVPELDLVMEKDGRLIGQNMFMRAVIKADDGRDIPIMAMGPICIAPEYKRQGYGKALLDHSLEKAAGCGCGALCFEGNIDFYGKSGFRYAREFGIRYHELPEGADDSFFLCRELIPGCLNGITGVYAPPEGYYAAEREPEAFAAYEAMFPHKEKQTLPGQLFQ